MAKPPPRERPIESNSDTSVFREAMRDVKPLKQPARVDASIAPAPRRRNPARHAHEEAVRDMPLLPDSAPPDEPDGPVSFRRPGVREQVMRQLRRGAFPIEDELDLHGLNQAQARDSLAQFLSFNRDAGRRCVRIIHGKGTRSGSRGPILKLAVRAWLKRHADVVAFTSARPIDGGSGAMYVLLHA